MRSRVKPGKADVVGAVASGLAQLGMAFQHVRSAVMADEIGGVVFSGVAFDVGALEAARDGLREGLGDEALRRAAPPVPFDARAGFVGCGHGALLFWEGRARDALLKLCASPPMSAAHLGAHHGTALCGRDAAADAGFAYRTGRSVGRGSELGPQTAARSGVTRNWGLVRWGEAGWWIAQAYPLITQIFLKLLSIGTA